MSSTNGATPVPPGVSTTIAHERGYVYVKGWTQLNALENRFLEYQKQTPGLLIPQYRLGLTPVHAWSLRPEQPRIDSNGKTVKYEHPAGVPLCLDVLPRYRAALDDAAVPVWITEGAKKSDALASAYDQAIVPISLNGVWGWRRRHKDGSSHPHEDLDAITWLDRPVVLAFDNDVIRKPDVQQALKAFARVLSNRGADVRVLVLPEVWQCKN